MYVDSWTSINSGILSEFKHYNGPDKITVENGLQLDIIYVENTTRFGLNLQEVFVVS